MLHLRSHGLLSCPEAHPRVVVLLVRLVVGLRVSDLSLEVVVVLGLVSADAIPESPLGIGINIHLDNSGTNGVLDVLNRRSGSSVEDKLHGLVVVRADLLLDVLLRVVQDQRLEVNISRGVNSVDISERGGAGEGTVLNLGELLVRVEDLLGLGVEAGRVDVSVVDTVLLSSGHTKLELEKNSNLGELLKVRLADADVLLEGLLGKVEHVRAEKRVALLGEVLLGGRKESIDPREPRLLAMVGVEYNRDIVKLGNLVNVLGSSNGSGDGGLVSIVGEGLSGNELSSSLGKGDHDGSSVLSGGLHAGVDAVGTNNVDSRDGVSCGIRQKMSECQQNGIGKKVRALLLAVEQLHALNKWHAPCSLAASRRSTRASPVTTPALTDAGSLAKV